MGVKAGKQNYGSKENIKTIEVSLLEEDYSDGIDRKLRAAGFKTAGTGGGSYEYQIEAKSPQEVVAIIKRAGVDPALFSI